MRFVAAALIFAGCANNDATGTTAPCAARIDCPNDRSPPLAAECRDAAFDPDCGAPYQGYFRCRQANQVCNGSGKLDEDASVARCNNELDAYVQCLGPVTDSGADDATIEDTSVGDTSVVDTSVVDSGATDAAVDTKPDVRPDATDAKLGG